jgi:hypothetical protein
VIAVEGLDFEFWRGELCEGAYRISN